MVSFQTSAGTPVTQLTQQHHHPPPESSQPPDQDTSNPWVSTESLKQHSQSHTDGGARNDQPIPDALQPGFHHVPRPPIPQIQQQDTGATTTTIGSTEFDATLSGSNGSTTPFDRVPSVLRPGGKSPNSNPFRNKEGSSASHTPTDAMAKMQLDSTTTNNPWGSALSAQRTGTPASEQDAASRGQQDPWSRLDAVELDATSYAHPPTPLSLPTPPNVPPSEVPTAEERSAWAGASQHMTGTQGIVDSQNTLAARPVDEFSHIFDDKQTWDDLGRTPRIKRRATNKTAGGEDSDQDDWNMIDSEASSVAGDAEAAGLSDARKPETEAKGPSIPGVGVLPVPAANTLAATETKAQDGVAEQRPVTPYVDAPTTPWDEPKSEDVQPNNNATVGVMAGAGMETKEKSPERPPVPTIHEPKNEPKLDAPLIEPIGYEAPAQSAPLRPPKTESALLEPEEKPAVPRQAEPAQRWSPTRQPVDGKAETYRIKNIRWKDPEASESPRVSPILVQNENGPCPLVALVNALSLTTPADTSETTLVQVLRSREQISLNLVLDAVFDELMSPRRTSSEDALPDISELYEFLQSLHTGMNVNPRFIPTEQMVKAYKRSSLTHLDPTEREALMPGTFENSLEMKLYATFSIPLIHGWLPARSEPAHDAFERQAASYEDAQNLLFREEELEAKLLDPQGGLSGTEQQLYQDVMTIKMFMRESATQLTAWGIEVIGKAIRPGTFAILFRNDHFSTLYCHPVTGQLLTLVTDAGYSGHEEVVWESLEDVNGELSALYSGDFRPVGSPDSAGPSNDDGGGQWTRVRSNRRGKDRQEDDEPDMGRVPDHEQEDRDLALALQLQEEEEERQREDQERRRRESRLSEQFIEQQGRQQPQPVSRVSGRRTSGAGGGGPPLPSRTSSTVNVSVSGVGGGRRSSNSSSGTPPPQPPRPQGQTVRPLVPPATAAPVTGLRPAGRPAVHRPAEDAAASGEEAPPSYEAAQHDRRYVPGQAGQGNGGGGPPGGSMAAGGGQRPGAGIAVPSSQGPGYMYRPQRPPYGGRTSQTSGRDRDCVVM